MKTPIPPARGVLAVAAAALLIVSAGCTCNKSPASPGPHQNTASDPKDMKLTSPGPHQ